MLCIRTTHAKDLEPSHWATWAAIQASDPALRSPYYHPRFIQLLVECGRDVRVAVIEEADGRVAGFFPYELDGAHRMRPAGRIVSDYQGAILRRGVDLDGADLLRVAGVSWFYFNHLPATQASFTRYQAMAHVSPVAQMDGGWQAYVKRLSSLDGNRMPSVIRQVDKSERRMSRDLGPVRFELHAKQSDDVLTKLKAWKTAQRVRTHALENDPFALQWVNDFLDRALHDGTSDFRGVLCALYAGDQLVACHYGLQTRDSLHLWFATYDWQWRYYQPSMVMFLHLLRNVPDEGVAQVDFGRGQQPYKLRLCTDMVPMWEGVVSRPVMLGQAWSATLAAINSGKQFVKNHPHVMAFRERLKPATINADHPTEA